MVPFASVPTPASSAFVVPPIQAFPSAKARLYARSAHTTPTTPSAAKLIIMVFREFLERTRPP
jgi:hypothetical protein